VLHQIEITGQDIATKKPASLMLLDETLTGDEINTVKIDDQGFVYTTNQDTDS
jgi:hypothetical protein